MQIARYIWLYIIVIVRITHTYTHTIGHYTHTHARRQNGGIINSYLYFHIYTISSCLACTRCLFLPDLCAVFFGNCQKIAHMFRRIYIYSI